MVISLMQVRMNMVSLGLNKGFIVKVNSILFLTSTMKGFRNLNLNKEMVVDPYCLFTLGVEAQG